MSDPATAAAAHGAPKHDAQAHHEVNYIAKFWWLVGLTTAEVLVAWQIEGGLKLGLLAVLSCWKAGIVLNYFMHLKMENFALKLALAFPVALIVILVVLFLLDGYWLERSFPG